MSRRRLNRRKPQRKPLPKMPPLPRLPRPEIDWSRLLLLPLVIALVGGAVTAGRLALDRPLRYVIVEGAFQRVTPSQIDAALGSIGDQSFISVDLGALRRAVAAIDWVDRVRLSRVWPDALRLHVTEHRAAASWGERGLLNTRGELFTEDARYDYAELPRLAGPEGSEQRVARLYLDVRGRLADANLMLDSIRMDERGALEIRLLSGQQIRVGRRDIDDRLERFFAIAAPALAPSFDRVDYIDMRYPNGFAVGWRDEPPEEDRRLVGMDRRG